MTLKEYNDKMDSYELRLDNGEDVLEEMYEFQYNYMITVVKNFDISTPAKRECREILKTAVDYCTNGSVIHYINDEQLAKDVMKIINDELGIYMLDQPVLVKCDGEYSIDCMFAGYYVPEWDGWEEEEW